VDGVFGGGVAKTAKEREDLSVIIGEKTLLAAHNPYIFNVKPSFGRI
jgi:hypothetical protein